MSSILKTRTARRAWVVAVTAVFIVVAVAGTALAAGRSGGGAGTCGQVGAVTATDGALSNTETADLLLMREEEKVARDLYVAFNELWNLRVFDNIARSEQAHMDAIGALLTSYRLDDPVGVDQPGVFQNQELQSLYDTLLAQGSESVTEALRVGVLVEQTDIADLQSALAGTDKADITQVYENLLKGSSKHLAAFSRAL